MPKLRYVGTSNWERTVVDDDGKYVKSERLAPGTEVDFDDSGAEKILALPRYMRDFVESGGPEDRYGDNFRGSRLDVSQVNGATPYPELDFGSTVTSNRSITRTEEDNPEGFTLATADEGPNVDNSELIVRNEAREAGRKAEEKALAEARKKVAPTGKTSAGGTSTPTRTSGDSGQTSNTGSGS